MPRGTDHALADRVDTALTEAAHPGEPRERESGWAAALSDPAVAAVLRDTADPLATVARAVGYGPEFAFAKAFKRRHGTAPGAYRRQAI